MCDFAHIVLLLSYILVGGFFSFFRKGETTKTQQTQKSGEGSVNLQAQGDIHFSVNDQADTSKPVIRQATDEEVRRFDPKTKKLLNKLGKPDFRLELENLKIGGEHLMLGRSVVVIFLIIMLIMLLYSLIF